MLLSRCLLGLVLAASFLSASAHEWASMPLPATQEPVLLKAIAPGVWLHTSYHTFPDGNRFPSNGLVVQHGQALWLIDTAWGSLKTVELLRHIDRQIGLPLEGAIVTHSHHDRLGGVDVLEARGIEVFAHPLTRQFSIEQGVPVPLHPLKKLDAAGSRQKLEGLEVFYPGPGHATDNVMVWLPQQRILFGGCAVRAGDTQSLGNTADANIEQWPQSIRRAIAHYPTIRTVVPGHGDVAGPELLQHTLTLFQQ